MVEPRAEARRRPARLGQAGLALRPVIAGRLARLRRLLQLWSARELERRYLASLNDAQLRDMRLTRAQVRREAGKPFWQG